MTREIDVWSEELNTGDDDHNLTPVRVTLVVIKKDRERLAFLYGHRIHACQWTRRKKDVQLFERLADRQT